jgi:CCR4-NOT transcription complex subunit 1
LFIEVFTNGFLLFRAVFFSGRKNIQEFETRKTARSEGRRYCDPVLLTYQSERLPEQVRARVGGATSSQMATYEFFNKIVPGFHPIVERELPPLVKQLPVSFSAINVGVKLSSPVYNEYFSNC